VQNNAVTKLRFFSQPDSGKDRRAKPPGDREWK
jgi:hypothetical protein